MKIAQEQLRKYLVKHDMTGYAFARALGHNKDYTSRFLSRDWDQAAVVLSIATKVEGAGMPPVFSKSCLLQARGIIDAEAALRDQRRRHHRLVGCVRGLEDSPCDGCKWHDTCAFETTDDAGRPLARCCEQFFLYTNPSSKSRPWQEGAKIPTVEWYKEAFPHYDYDEKPEDASGKEPGAAVPVSGVREEDSDTFLWSSIRLGTTQADQ